MTVRLRPARDQDAPAVAAVWESAWRDGHLGHVPGELVALRTPESFRLRAAAMISRTTVASSGAGIAGFAAVDGDEVAQVFVAESARGSGVAGALLGEAERRVAAAGYRTAWLAVVAGNARARRFYERSGWFDDGPFEYAAPDSGGTVTVPCHRYTKMVG